MAASACRATCSCLQASNLGPARLRRRRAAHAHALPTTHPPRVLTRQDNLGLMKVGDKIEFIKTVKGAENLVNSTAKAPKPAPAPAPEEAAPAEAASEEAPQGSE